MNRLRRQTRPLPLVSIIPLADVLLILLVFFMVTSTFLDLDMLPMSQPQSAEGGTQSDTRTVLLRILPGGAIATGGKTIAPSGIESFLAEQKDNRVLLLPSPQADVQALVTVLDIAARLGLASVSVLRFAEND